MTIISYARTLPTTLPHPSAERTTVPSFPIVLRSLEAPMPRRGVDSTTTNGSEMNEMINNYALMMHIPHHMPSSACLTSFSMI